MTVTQNQIRANHYTSVAVWANDGDGYKIVLGHNEPSVGVVETVKKRRGEAVKCAISIADRFGLSVWTEGRKHWTKIR